MYPITTISTSFLSLIYLILAVRVVSLRRLYQISVGSKGNKGLKMAIRAHGNFSEYTPLTLILCLCAEINHLNCLALTLLMSFFVLGRLIHAHVFLHNPRLIKLRIVAMMLTFIPIAGLALINLSSSVLSYFKY
ncbi:MAPEG family protein [Legionella sp. km772]|uniref:MAPEG family protein n=1 Tax=Legionella sp. km772 TaxID=2498111 RepID=UPI000F8EB889|nr:MAPEG family protein [Legionella sp. km772]RUR12488.1 glutathione S-transferase [Legionella sp. km772]